ncbi:MAG: TraY domain-containing protein [Gammaproteobacteria bacterium]|nr:TraY domain-containing protein [Gammaproteobacteria bacterium]
MLALHLPADIEQRLNTLAEKTGRSTTSYAQEAIELHLTDLEDASMATDRLATTSKRWTQAELEAGVDLES